MTTLRQQMEDILHERQLYSWKDQDPFQLSEKSLGGVIPIISNMKGEHARGRKYELYEEAEKKSAVRVTDSGRIERLKVVSNSDKPIFVRMGTVFTGDTQPRAASLSVFIMPEKEAAVPTKRKEAKEVEIPVKCVHASHGITQGTGMVMASATAPRNVMHSFMSGGSQSAVWSGVREYSCRAARHYTLSAGSDDFLGVREQVRKAKDTIGNYIKKIPRLANQVGVIIFDAKGIAGIEVFDHPDSWKAFQDSVYEEYEDVLLAKQEEIVYKVDKEALYNQVKKFLKECFRLEGKLEFEEGKAKTFLLKGEKKVGEFSLLDSKIIHFIIMRKEPKPKTYPSRVFVGGGDSSYPSSFTGAGTGTRSNTYTITDSSQPPWTNYY